MKVFGIQTIDLGPDVSSEELEQVVRDGWASLPDTEGWHMYLLKGKYGQRVGKYVLLVEVDSLERRDQLYPPDGHYTPEVLAYLQTHPEIGAFEDARTKLVARLAGYSITDYVVVAESAPKAE